MHLKGVHLPHFKGTQFVKTIDFEVPEKAIFPMSQHMGAPCEPLVKKGDTVTVGQKIGDSTAFMSTPIHSSVSGTVVDIIEYLQANGSTCQAIVVETDGLQTLCEEIKPPVVTNRETFLSAIKESGCCGLGGAGFPTHVKFAFDKEKTPIDTLVINGAECEPYITADYREMIESTEEIIEGIELTMKYLDIKYCAIGIEKNKPQGIKKLIAACAHNDNIKVYPLKAEYPQGAEKVIAYHTTGRVVGDGELPSHKGIMVANISTISFVSKYLRTGMPLIKKRLTVEGDLVRKPCNVFALIGTPVSYLLNQCNTNTKRLTKLITGGPMMGMPLYDTEAPVLKTNNALLALSKKAIFKNNQTACIRCGRCANTCPMNLMPMNFERGYDTKNIESLKKDGIMACMNCGCCSYTCPAKRNLAEKNMLAKALIPRN